MMHFGKFFVTVASLVIVGLAADPQIVYVGNVQFNLGSTIQAGSTPEGSFVYVDIDNGWFNTTSNYTAPGYPEAPPLAGAILPGGNDYARLREDNSTGIDVAVAFRSADPQQPDLFWYTSYGYVAPGIPAPGSGDTEFGENDNYQVIKINTNSTTYAWLNAALLVGQERLIIEDDTVVTVELRVFRVVVNP